MQDKETEFVKPVRVFVTNQGWHDYEAAKKYGRLFPITQGNVDFRHTDRLRATIITALEDMEPDDFICISGSPVIVGEVFAVVMQKFGVVNYIYWEPFINDYLPRTTKGLVPELGDLND